MEPLSGSRVFGAQGTTPFKLEGNEDGTTHDEEERRALADAIIRQALKRNPERLGTVIADVACSFAKEGRYSAEEIKAAIDELLDQLRLPRH
jgi:hypothetical protein